MKPLELIKHGQIDIIAKKVGLQEEEGECRLNEVDELLLELLDLHLERSESGRAARRAGRCRTQQMPLQQQTGTRLFRVRCWKLIDLDLQLYLFWKE